MTDIRPGQIYHHVRYPKQIRITEYRPGDNRADVIDAKTGKRPRSILVAELHATAETRDGSRRRTGYYLAQDAV